ncbi:DNA-processing protein DprA [Psychrobacillus lasiicapitis]|uniref:DNA-protecting protein DprA n=1 Tax=Psychrobacillus lasiicapitis TaxID=1636719 RepID=A0A544TF03_9BACI|nr:DNA-processing protein DprA [Psychrobacillus lasiicapitis]TQR16030.1 DNA-protecting protein DprA [Psychrobacillus lasiicapitis]GGA16239.1 DNA processing protein DprA [Psychrobacillus lasiicapitis]
MKDEQFLQRFLALHYVFPVPLNKIKPLLEYDPNLTQLETMKPSLLASLGKISQDRAIKLQEMYRKYVEIPLLQIYEKHAISPIIYTNPNYPSNLLNLYDPPAVLYIKGDINLLLNDKKLAIIGSREATAYSKSSIEKILPPLIQNNFVIVSGLAKGADTLAHEMTMQYGGNTIAVLGTGFFHMYPKQNENLAHKMSKNQLLVTEYPPYITPKKWNFPMRNRIISGLSQGVVITEAKEKSGTVSTMEHALENGKEIFAVPGSIFSPLSAGPHHLILEGAKPVWDGHQILEELLK